MSSIASSSSLFEIDHELDALLEEIQEQFENNGVAAPEKVALFDDFLRAHGEKIDRVGRFIRAMEARSNHCRTEAQRLSDRARVSENKITRTKAMVLYYLMSRGLRKVEGLEFTLRKQANSQDSVIISDEEQIPLEYKTLALRMHGGIWKALLDCVPAEIQQTLKDAVKESHPDNDAIKAAALQRETVPGAMVKRGEQTNPHDTHLVITGIA